MFFRRALAFATVLTYFALSTHAQPMHHPRVTAVVSTTSGDAGLFMDNMKAFQKNIEACSDDISKAASTGKDPEEDMKKLNGYFTGISIPSSVKLSSDQEKECTVIVTTVITKSIKACHDVAAKHNYMKYYAKWTETDFAMHSFTQQLAGMSFPMYKQSLIGAGKKTAVHLHDMKMRHMVNNFRGMGISYE